MDTDSGTVQAAQLAHKRTPDWRSVTVELPGPGRRYDIRIGMGLLGNPESYQGLGGGHAVVVTNDTVGPLYAQPLVDALSVHFKEVGQVSLPDGEAYKTWQSLDHILTTLLASACDRKTVLFALGGGVVGDLTGFAAACYMRGIDFVQVPTTLLAQVDSSVGGKTAINHPLGKNMVGAFHQPLRVVADLSVLDTLAPAELAAGLAEVIKYGPIADATFLDWIEAHLPDLLAREPQAMAYAVQRSCEIKAQIVAADERESGLREILNFGHTFGHAIEAGVGYGGWLHGQAVGCGMVMAADLSVRLGLLPEADAQRLQQLIARTGLPVQGPGLGAEPLLALMRVDKKAQDGAVRFVLLDRLGHAVVRPVGDQDVLATLAAHGG